MSIGGHEVVPFSDDDTLRALETINLRRPSVVALERGFASTPRGAAIINRISADPTLQRSVVRIVAPALSEPTTLSPSAPTAETSSADTTPAVVSEKVRRVPRFELTASINVTIDNNSASLINLSTLGAQVLSNSVLKPNQRVRLAVSDGKATVRATGTIIWANFEIPPGNGPRYRAGIEFVNPDRTAFDTFCHTHRQ